MINPYEPPRSDLRQVGKAATEAGPSAAPQAKLAWYDQVWLALPFGLMIVGGAIGGAIGGAAWALNQKIFRSPRHPFSRYALSGIVSVAAVVAYLGAVLAFVSLFPGNG